MLANAMKRAIGRYGPILLLLGLAPTVTQAQTITQIVEPISIAVGGDGTMSAAARQAMNRGALPAGRADVDAKKAANAASAAALASAGPSDRSAPQVGGRSSGRELVVASGFLGQSDSAITPPDTTGATGRTRYIQLTNRRIGIYNRTSSVPIFQGSLNTLAAAPTANNFDPQIIWDGNTNKFWYAMDSVFSSADNRLAFGFSKTGSPNNASSDWCHYLLPYGARFPDYPKLGDSNLFIFIGVNNFQPSFVGADIVAVRKTVGTASVSTCPSLGTRRYIDLRDQVNQLVFTPTPANGIDASSNAYTISRNLALPSNSMWIHALLGGSATTFPTLQTARRVVVPSYSVPADAVQPNFPGGVAAPRLDTLDARPWQAIFARNPNRGNAFSFWTQHTVPNGATTMLRFFEIRPDVNPPILLRNGTAASSGSFLFNGAISSDRRPGVGGTGGSFVIGYSVSSTTINPRIVAGSSVNGGAVSFSLIRDGAGPYRDFTCASSANTCRWGDYSGATPDPLPTGGAISAVGLTNQFSPGGAMSTGTANWRTWIFHVRP